MCRASGAESWIRKFHTAIPTISDNSAKDNKMGQIARDRLRFVESGSAVTPVPLYLLLAQSNNF